MTAWRLGLVALFGLCGTVHAEAAHAKKGRMHMQVPGAPCDVGVTMPEAPKGRLKSLYPRGTMLTSAVTKMRKAAKADFRVRAAPLGPALAAFLCAAGGEVTLPDSALSGRSPGVEGEMSPRQALERLLAGTGLSVAAETDEGFILK